MPWAGIYESGFSIFSLSFPVWQKQAYSHPSPSPSTSHPLIPLFTLFLRLVWALLKVNLRLRFGCRALHRDPGAPPRHALWRQLLWPPGTPYPHQLQKTPADVALQGPGLWLTWLNPGLLFRGPLHKTMPCSSSGRPQPSQIFSAHQGMSIPRLKWEKRLNPS